MARTLRFSSYWPASLFAKKAPTIIASSPLPWRGSTLSDAVSGVTLTSKQGKSRFWRTSDSVRAQYRSLTSKSIAIPHFAVSCLKEFRSVFKKKARDFYAKLHDDCRQQVFIKLSFLLCYQFWPIHQWRCEEIATDRASLQELNIHEW